MSDAKAEEVKFSLKVMVNKERTKVLFAESDSHFVDVLLSFLTLPLGKIIEVMKKHYKSEAPSFGCLNALHSSVADLDSSHFWTEGAKEILLDPTSLLHVETQTLKLQVIDSNCAWFNCVKCPSNSFWSGSIYYDKASCKICGATMERKLATKYSQAKCSSGVFTLNTTAFVITDDLRIMPNATGLEDTLSTLHIEGTNGSKLMNVTLGHSDVIDLLRASMISQTPLSDLFLRRKSNSRRGLSLTEYLISCYGGKLKVEKPTMFAKAKDDFSDVIHAPLLLKKSMILCETKQTPVEKEETPESKKMILQVMVQKSTNRLLFAQAKEDFVEFLFSLLAIPLGGVESTEISTESIDNLYRSVTDLIDDKYFKNSYVKYKLINPKIPHGYISKNQILPLTEEKLPSSYQNISLFSSETFPQGQGKYIKGSRVYQVMDDLTVKPFSISSILCSLSSRRIPVSDVKELEMEIGIEEAWSILKASLTSDSALTNALMNRVSIKHTKP